MAEVDEMVDGIVVRLAAPGDVRARGEQRRTRRRVAVGAAAVVVAAALGAGSWAALPGGGTRSVGPATSATASATATPSDDPTSGVTWTPYVVDGVINLIDASELPLNATLHWRVDEKQEASDVAKGLPSAGLDGACGHTVNGVSVDGYSMGGNIYTGEDGAKARHRVVHYESAEAAGRAAQQQRDYLTEQCGLTWRGDSQTPRYAGTAKRSGQPLVVTVEQYGSYVSVIEVQGVAKLAD